MVACTHIHFAMGLGFIEMVSLIAGFTRFSMVLLAALALGRFAVLARTFIVYATTMAAVFRRLELMKSFIAVVTGLRARSRAIPTPRGRSTLALARGDATRKICVGIRIKVILNSIALIAGGAHLCVLMGTFLPQLMSTTIGAVLRRNMRSAVFTITFYSSPQRPTSNNQHKKQKHC